MWLVLIAAAMAAPPASVLPFLDAPARVASLQEEARTRGAAEPACRDFAPGLMACFTVVDDKGKDARIVTAGDLEAWKTDLTAVEAVARNAVAAGIRADRPAWVAVEGDTRRYLLSAEGDGLDQAFAFHPAALQERLGTPSVAIGLPAAGVLIAFPLGDPELQTMVSVGIRRAWEKLDGPISPVVYTWTGGEWVPWGEARPASVEVPCPVPSKP